jgi:hypothetical protein
VKFDQGLFCPKADRLAICATRLEHDLVLETVSSVLADSSVDCQIATLARGLQVSAPPPCRINGDAYV